MSDITTLNYLETLRAQKQVSGDAFSSTISAEGLYMDVTVNGKPVGVTYPAEGENPPVQAILHEGYDMQTEPYDVTSGQKKGTLGKVSDAYNADGTKSDTVNSTAGNTLDTGKPQQAHSLSITITPTIAAGVSLMAGIGSGYILRSYTKLNPYLVLGASVLIAGFGYYLLTDNIKQK